MNENFRFPFVLALALLTLVPRPTLAQTVSGELQSIVAENMHEQMARIGAVKSAIVAGNLEEVHKPAIWLADRETVAGLPADFEPFIAQIKTYARHLIEAEDLVSAAEAVSKMAKTCGDCHVANGVDLEFGYDQLPRKNVEDVVTHMQRHQWAADRLWDGLIGPSNSAWNRGVDMLIDVPLAPEDVTTTTAHFSEMSSITRRIHALGGNGTETVTSDARSELYSEVLSLCASCHTMLGRGPGN